MLSFTQTEQIALEARDALYSAGFDTYPVEVHVGYLTPYSYCIQRKGTTHIVLGVWSWWSGNVEWCTSLLFHEFGHAWMYQYWDGMRRSHKDQFLGLFGDIHTTPNWFREWFPSRLYDKSSYLNEYATLSPEEDWAECFSEFMTTNKPLSSYPVRIRKKLRFVKRMLETHSS